VTAILPSRGSAVAEQPTHDTRFKGSSPDTPAIRGDEKVEKITTVLKVKGKFY
jgi:hypothetical protein